MKDIDFLAEARRIIYAESTALDLLSNSINGNFFEVARLMLHCAGKVVVTGMGKSGIVAQKVAATLRSTGQPAIFLHPGEAAHGDMGMLERRDLVLAISNSGETEELRLIIDYCKRHMGPEIIAITRHKDSMLGRAALFVLEIPDVQEGCPLGLAPMASTTMQMALGDALAGCLMQAREFKPKDFHALHHGGYLGSQLSQVA